MELKEQNTASKIIIEQAEKLGKALSTLRKIAKLDTSIQGDDIQTATLLASNALREISNYGKNPKDL